MSTEPTPPAEDTATLAVTLVRLLSAITASRAERDEAISLLDSYRYGDRGLAIRLDAAHGRMHNRGRITLPCLLCMAEGECEDDFVEYEDRRAEVTAERDRLAAQVAEVRRIATSLPRPLPDPSDVAIFHLMMGKEMLASDVLAALDTTQDGTP